MAHTVFFTVGREDNNKRSKIILELLAKKYKAKTLVLDHFDPKRDSEEVSEFVALADLSHRQFTGVWHKASLRFPGLPTWAKIAKGRVVIGPKALLQSEHCAEMVYKHFPDGFVPTDLPLIEQRNSRREL